MEVKNIKPIIKWAGGKRQLLIELKKRLPKEFNRYFEPFLGAGALFFDLQPQKAFINDYNHSLINLYQCCRDNPIELKKELQTLQDEFNLNLNKNDYYYKKRIRYNQILNKDSFEEAALFVFLNRTNYNGLYRVNSKGEFNVPFGQKSKVDLMVYRIDEVYHILMNSTITEGDFEIACLEAEKGDFVYFDPPYYNTFVNYQADGFSKDEQLRLFKLFEELSSKGVYCMLSNSNTEFIKDLYKDFYIEVVSVKRLISRNASLRISEEVIITNYEVNYDK